MERYRLLGIEHGGRESASARVVSREPNKWGVFPLHTFNSGDEVVLAADAQATIAALQARVQELEDDRSAWKETAQDWSAAAKLAEQPEKFYEGYSAAVMNAMQALLTKARAELTQRTAELERVTGELQKAERCISEWVDRHSTYFSKLEIDFAKLHALIAALPKVEGEITCSQQFDSAWRLHYWQVEAYEVAGECVYRLNNLREDDAKAYAALLQHRQGME